MNVRELVQAKAVESFDERGIILAAPRVGKIRIALNILRRQEAKRVLICYPRNDIQKGWLDEIELLGCGELQIEYSTFHSLKKRIGRKYDCFIIDEIHEASDAQLDVMDVIVEQVATIALTGTMTATTAKNIEARTGLTTCFVYPIEQAVKDGVLCDYEINIHLVELDDKKEQYESKKGRVYTEKRWFEINEFLKKKTKNNAFFDNKLINIIQNSLSKLNKTRALLREAAEERVIVFCGTTNMTDALGIPVYHSKERNEGAFKAFCEGKILRIATIKMAQAGIKIVPISRAIFGYTSGAPEEAAQKICRVLATELWHPGKKAQIDIVSCKEKFETNRIKTALSFFDGAKIKRH